MKPFDIKSIRIKLASPEEILSWSHGEVTKPETINYRTGKPDREGLFSEIIFGPLKNFECSCGKYKGYQYSGHKCDRCGVLVTRSSVRRERMGHVMLATAVMHIWFLKVYPYPISLLLGIPNNQLEKVVYYSAYIIVEVDEEKKRKLLESIGKEYKEKLKTAESKELKAQIEETYKKIREELNSIKVKKILSDVEYFMLSRKYPGIFEVDMGAEPIRKFLAEIDLEREYKKTLEELKKAKGVEKGKISLKLKFLKSFIENKIRPEWMVLTVLPVIPPDLRPIVQLEGGKIVASDLNDLYRRVINRNNRLKRLYEIKAPEIIVRNEKRMLQEAVDILLDNTLRKERLIVAQRKVMKSLADMLRGKQGRFRQNLLGKRVDYSGRALIVIGPELKIDECGLPKKMALEIFKPFIIYELIKRGIALTIKQANYIIESEDPEAVEILNQIIKDKYVLLNRAPTLHRLGIQAFKPTLVEGLALRIPALVCAAYNADFDGDQMGVFLPISEEAQQEARERMLASKNHLKPGNGEVITTPTKDIILGCYYLTQILPGKKGEGKKVYDFQEAKLLFEYGEIDLQAEIVVKRYKDQEDVKTSVGRLIFNEALPADYQFLNQVITKKTLAKILADIYSKYGPSKTSYILDKIKNLGFEYAALSGISWSMFDLQVPAEKKSVLRETLEKERKIKETYKMGLLSDEERKMLITDIWLTTTQEINNLIKQTLKEDNNPRRMIDSGARGSYAQLGQMCGMKGLVANPKGETIELPIMNSYYEGLSNLEYFISTHGARKGASDTALKTAKAGYLTRRMIDAVHDVIITDLDCGDEEGIIISKQEAEESYETFADKIYSRVILETVKDRKGKIIINRGEYINREIAKKIEEAGIEKVRVRSPFTCKAIWGICSKCYGFDLAYDQPVKLGEAVGIIAAQSIGEPGTQLTMRTFHVGGIAGAADITQGVPRAEELLEVRTPKNLSILSPVNGVVENIEEVPKYWKISLRGPKRKKMTIHIPRSLNLVVKKGSRIAKGDPLNEGVKDPKLIYIYQGKMSAFKYILNEFKKVYNFQGAEVHDKHVEVVIRKMFSRVRIKEIGDSPFAYNDIVEKSVFLATNQKLREENKKTAKGILLLLGITKVALTSESFLSSSSFQETSRVLVVSALEAKEDRLRGLKENIIIGRKPYIGANFKKEIFST